jgi:hypothetical protein
MKDQVMKFVAIAGGLVGAAVIFAFLALGGQVGAIINFIFTTLRDTSGVTAP